VNNQTRPSLLQQALEGGGPFTQRTLAILLMVAGAIGFAMALVLFEGQLWCLIGSTLIVFAGLWLTVIIRYRQVNPTDSGRDPGWQPAAPERYSQTPTQRGRLNQAPVPKDWSQPERVPDRAGRRAHSQGRSIPARSTQQAVFRLTDQVSQVLRQQGVQVRIEAQRENRSILQVRARSGMTFTGLVLESQGQVDVSEVRSLYGLMAASGSIGAFMVSGGAYTPQAEEWARQRALTLLVASQVDEILID